MLIGVWLLSMPPSLAASGGELLVISCTTLTQIPWLR
uniref:Uncharacterized protein n=1 Tax=Arundo donax TaxID=35708 RepID=A0A0A9DLX8_ARUDO